MTNYGTILGPTLCLPKSHMETLFLLKPFYSMWCLNKAVIDYNILKEALKSRDISDETMADKVMYIPTHKITPPVDYNCVLVFKPDFCYI